MTTSKGTSLGVRSLMTIAALLVALVGMQLAPTGSNVGVAEATAAKKKQCKRGAKRKRCARRVTRVAPRPIAPAPVAGRQATVAGEPATASGESHDHEPLPLSPPGERPEEWSVLPPDSGGPLPAFKLPFRCDEVWRGSTYAGHGAGNYALDLNHANAGFEYSAPVVASLSGRVAVSQDGYNGGYGNYVVIDHGGGWTTLYAHLRVRQVGVGQQVGRGQQLGIVGTTGNSTGVHLHFEQRLGGRLQHISFDGGHISYAASFRSTNCVGDEPPPIAASLDAQILPDGVTAGGPAVPVGFNIRFNQPYTTDFVLRPDPATAGSIGHFMYIPNTPPTGDWPGVRPSNDDRVGYFRGSVRASAATTQGYYFLRWLVVNKQTGQVAPGIMPSFWVKVGNPPYGLPPVSEQWDARFGGYDRDPLIAPGEESCLTQRLRNSGMHFWGRDVRLGTPDDSPILHASSGVYNRNRVSWSADEDGNEWISPGETATFRYCIRVPVGQSAAYRQRFTLVRDAPNGGRFAQHLGLFVPVLVTDENHVPGVDVGECRWAFVTQAGAPLEANRLLVRGSERASFSFTIRNTSELCPWFPTGEAPFRLATNHLRDRASGYADLENGWVTTNRIRLPEVVAPGGTVTIPFGLKAPPSVPPGPYAEYLNPVIEGRYHLDDRIGMHVPIMRR